MTIWPDYNGGRTAADVKYRFQWTYPIIVSPTTARQCMPARKCCSDRRTSGQSWEAISPDLTRNDKAKEHGGRLEEYYSTIFTIAESPRAERTSSGLDPTMVSCT